MTCTCGHDRERHAGWNGCLDCNLTTCPAFERDVLADDLDALVRATQS